MDGDYLFCMEESNDMCWNGTILSEVLQQESSARLDVKINLWAYRHIAIGIAKTHVKEITEHFEKDDKAWDRVLAANPNYTVYA